MDTSFDWRTEVDPWGAWHLPNTTARHSGPCFNVEVTSNSYGARDRERTRAGKDRVLVIGDSSVEGWGVEAEFRFTNVMEEAIGREVMNFGTNHFFGPLQYEILYRDLASDFEHDLLIIGFAPHNDFTDNDVNIWKDTDQSHRYRPYYAPDGGDPIYLVERPATRQPISQMEPPKPTGLKALAAFLKEHTWSFQVFERAYERLSHKLRDRHTEINPGRDYSGFSDFEEYQLNNVLGSFRRISLMARQNGARMIIAMIPAKNDLKLERGDDKLTPIIKQFGVDNGIEVVDFWELDLDRGDFQECNWFLSNAGHGKIGTALSAHVETTLTTP